MNDPNWLLSTCVQSTAALIAIIGGFFVSRLITLSSEKNGLLNELDEIIDNLKTKNQFIQDINLKILNIDQEDFFERCKEDIINDASNIFFESIDLSGFGVSFEKYFLNNNVHKRNSEELKDFFQEKINVIKGAFEFFKDKFGEVKKIDDDFNNFIINNKIEIDEKNKQIYRDVYNAILDKVGSSNSQGIFNYDFHKIGDIQIKSIPEIQRYEKLVNDKESLELEKKSIEIQKQRIEDRLKHFGKPIGLTGAIYVFAYSAIVGIIYPILLMPATSESFSSVDRFVVLGLFLSGIIAVIIYLIFSLRNLSK